MPAATKNIIVEQGAGFRLLVTWKDSTGALVDLTGYTGKAQVRSSFSSSIVALEFDVVTGGTAATVLVTADDEATSACVLQKDKGVWDLKLTPSAGEPIRLLQGRVALSRETTR